MPTIPEKLRKAADGVQARIDVCFAPRLTNTHKRVSEDQRMRKEGRELQQRQRLLRALADCHEQGLVPESLAGIRSRKDIDTILTLREYPSNPYNYDHLDEWVRVQSARLARVAIFSDAGLQAAKRALADLDPGDQDARKEAIRKAEQAMVGVPIPGFFPTPAPLIDRMLDEADIRPGHRILEPSAGLGHIADRIMARYQDVTVTCVEISTQLADICAMKGHETINGDFLHIDVHATDDGYGDTRFDRIVMNPPFEQSRDIHHVNRAYRYLRPGGILVALMSESTFHRGNRQSEDFRTWLDILAATVHDVEAGAFAKGFRSTGVKTRMVVIHKPERAS